MSDTQDQISQAEDLRAVLDDTHRVSVLLGRSLSSGFRSAVVEGRKFEDVVKSIALRLSGNALAQAFRPLENLLSSGIQSAIGAVTGQLSGAPMPQFFARGGAFAAGRPIPFAEGGIVDAPRLFPMANGATGLMGEAGAEAILPLSRGPDGRLGVRAGGTAGRAVNVTVNISTPDVEGFRKAEAQVSGMLARAVGRGRRGH
ncbi:MAG: phage tail tape measure protein [Hyphomicrobiaceae bacterium]|nr:phage tail tape measure protein [Hyphomicrobiaceae bacterium]